jgi:5-methylcytosine-specific restriction endonuclease McrA
MHPIIHIESLVSFNPGIGVLVHQQALSVSTQRLFDLVKLAHSHMDDEALCDAWHGGVGPVAEYLELTYDQYLDILEREYLGDWEQERIDEAAKNAKRDHTSIRRRQFQAHRSRLALAMIDARIPYVCAILGCNSIANLTIDHILALSRGGTDELQNLRFLCRSHNSAKSDKDEADFLPTMKKSTGDSNGT